MILFYDTIINVTAIKKLKEKLRRGSKLSCQEVRRILGEMGYSLARQKGSHEQWIKQGRTFTLACHKKEAPYYILDALKKILEESDG